jgi:hypothetical protein
MTKRILFVLMAVVLISAPALAGNRPEFDAVGFDAANVFVDQFLRYVADINIDGFGREIDFALSDFTKVAGPVFNPTFAASIPGPAFAEFFVTSAGQLYPDPCFAFLKPPADDTTGVTALSDGQIISLHLPYLSALTTVYNQGTYRWRIVLQLKPESDININIRDCVFKENQTDLAFYADQTGYYRQPWGQLVFLPSANPSIYVYAIPGPYATAGFTTPVILDARTMPGLTPTALFNALYTTKALFEEGLVAALPFTGNTNTSGQLVYDLHQGDMIDVTVTIPFNNTVDVRYGPDNVFVKYIGIVGTDYTNGLTGG